MRCFLQVYGVSIVSYLVIYFCRPQSVSKKEVILSPREEQFVKKIKSMEEDINAFKEKEKKWKELRQTKVPNFSFSLFYKLDMYLDK